MPIQLTPYRFHETHFASNSNRFKINQWWSPVASCPFPLLCSVNFHYCQAILYLKHTLDHLLSTIEHILCCLQQSISVRHLASNSFRRLCTKTITHRKCFFIWKKASEWPLSHSLRQHKGSIVPLSGSSSRKNLSRHFVSASSHPVEESVSTREQER